MGMAGTQRGQICFRHIRLACKPLGNRPGHGLLIPREQPERQAQSPHVACPERLLPRKPEALGGREGVARNVEFDDLDSVESAVFPRIAIESGLLDKAGSHAR